MHTDKYNDAQLFLKYKRIKSKRNFVMKENVSLLNDLKNALKNQWQITITR